MSASTKQQHYHTAVSSSSVYTTEERQDKYETLEDVLSTKCSDGRIQTVIRDLFQVCADITDALRVSLVTVEGSTNDFGDSQLSVDLIADKMIWDAVRKSTVIREGASEEDPIVRNVTEQGANDDNVSSAQSEAEFTVCWDPLDGSSIVDNNWAVGTMIGVWPKSTGLIGATGRDQVTSIVALYGPRTTILVALDNGTYEFTYGCAAGGATASTSHGSSFSTPTSPSDHPTWICTRQQIQIQSTSKRFSPANMRAAQDLPGYKKLIDYYMTNRYTLRYTGGMVPDVYQQFTKKMGVFCNPTSEKSPAKLRLAFEAAPFGLLVEKAGGRTSDGVTGASILDVPILSVDQRTALCMGSAEEVQRFNDLLGLSK